MPLRIRVTKFKNTDDKTESFYDRAKEQRSEGHSARVNPSHGKKKMLFFIRTKPSRVLRYRGCTSAVFSLILPLNFGG